MTIKARCGSCGTNFQAKDSLAGKRVKCPKCAQPIVIGAGNPTAPAGKTGTATQARPGQAAAGKRPTTAGTAAAAGAYNPLLDLLDEVNVKSAVRGPMCPNCSAEMKPGSILCVSCGFNIETGERLRTSVYDDDEDTGIADVGLTDADRIMSKAERDIDDMPVTAHGQDFGDGADSFVIAGIAGVILLILLGAGLTTILMMETITQYVAPWFISLLAAITLFVVMAGWITFVAFRQKPAHGIACIGTGGLWCIVYGFMQGKELLLPTVILLVSLIIGGASGAYTAYAGIKAPQEQNGN